MILFPIIVGISIIGRKMTLKALKAGRLESSNFTFKWNKDSVISIIPQVLRDVGVFCGFEAGVGNTLFARLSVSH